MSLPSLVYLFFFLFTISCFSQTGKITYEILSFGNTISNEPSILIYNDSISHFWWYKNSKRIQTRENETLYSLDSEDSDNLSNSFTHHFGTQHTIAAIKSGDTLNYISKNYPNYDWSLTDEQMVISGYDCQKAKALHRGREVFAWFTTSIPSKFGPMEFINLPGLVLTAGFEDKSFIVSVTQIEFSNKYSEVLLEKFESLSCENLMTEEEYINMVEKNLKELERTINSRRKKEQAPLKFKKCEDC